jgi:hypothetical protein
MARSEPQLKCTLNWLLAGSIKLMFNVDKNFFGNIESGGSGFWVLAFEKIRFSGKQFLAFEC